MIVADCAVDRWLLGKKVYIATSLSLSAATATTDRSTRKRGCDEEERSMTHERQCHCKVKHNHTTPKTFTRRQLMSTHNPKFANNVKLQTPSQCTNTEIAHIAFPCCDKLIKVFTVCACAAIRHTDQASHGYTKVLVQCYNS